MTFLYFVTVRLMMYGFGDDPDVSHLCQIRVLLTVTVELSGSDMLML
jgi:hypothetical protein